MNVKQGLIFLLWAVLLIGQAANAQIEPEKETRDTTRKKPVNRPRKNIPKRKSKKAKRDTSYRPLRFAGIRFGADVLPTMFGVLNDNLESYQGTFEVLLNNKYFIELSGGIDHVTRKGVSNYTYRSKGMYGRIGVNYNMLHRKSKDDAIYVGLHFGYAQFDNQINYQINNTVTGNVDRQITEKQLSGAWLEGNFGFKVELFKNFYMGPMFRVKFKLGGSKGELLEPNDIPGYGVNNGGNFAFGYHLLYRLPFGKKAKKKRRSKTNTNIKEEPPGKIKDKKTDGKDEG